ncbi:hypothetical protein CQ14_06665 [Bradyrhizobium lablabi]|uniref:Uncharacterized protein n=1 Tax=Bradyrhizobium lablabi TaxID=722472 RepID=A0A0R3MP25_9BRAD|nr:hypothetical protein [Bradyrhizobium lablabi]KRR21326.1 hypothetical protein CQ14_06665 [Bradyrhizobium lablabi]
MSNLRSDEPRIRVTRTIVYEGRESWVRQTLEHSFIGSSIFAVASGRIFESGRIEEPLPAEEDDDNA